MILATPEETAKRLPQYNSKGAAIKRYRPFIPFVIPKGADTTSTDGKIHCLALLILNLPTQQKRLASINNLKKKNPDLYKEVIPYLDLLTQKYLEQK